MNLRRLWPLRRPANPAAVREFRIAGQGEVHRVEAGAPLADARERGARVLFETDDPQRYMVGEARDASGKLVAMICGWTSYSLGHVADADGVVREKRRAAAWGWPVEAPAPEPEQIVEAEPAAKPKRARRKAPPPRPAPQGDPSP